MSKILNPKAWYLVGAGAVAVVADGARRLIRRRRSDGAAGYRSADVAVETEAKAKKPATEPVVKSAPTAEAKTKTKKGVEEKGQQASAAKSKAAEPATRTAAAQQGLACCGLVDTVFEQLFVDVHHHHLAQH